MTLAELAAIVARAMDTGCGRDPASLTVAVETQNGGCPTRHHSEVARAGPGFDWTSNLFVIRPAVFPEGPGESHERSALAYPCATEHDGKLYVGYSNNGPGRGNNNSAELAIIPIEKLRCEP